VPRVQCSAHVESVERIFFHQTCFEGHAELNQPLHGVRIGFGELANGVPMRTAVQVGVLDHLRPTGGNLASGQGFQENRIYKNALGAVKRAHGVLQAC
jgi:hypothetical protein